MSHYDGTYMYHENLSNTWSSTHQKVKQHWGWVEKSVACKKMLKVQSTQTKLANVIIVSR